MNEDLCVRADTNETQDTCLLLIIRRGENCLVEPWC